MGELLTVLFIATVLFVSGLILAFAGDEKGRKPGMILIAIGLIIYLACWMFTPNNDNFRLRNETIY